MKHILKFTDQTVALSFAAMTNDGSLPNSLAPLNKRLNGYLSSLFMIEKDGTLSIASGVRGHDPHELTLLVNTGDERNHGSLTILSRQVETFMSHEGTINLPRSWNVFSKLKAGEDKESPDVTLCCDASGKFYVWEIRAAFEDEQARKDQRLLQEQRDAQASNPDGFNPLGAAFAKITAMSGVDGALAG